MFGCRIQVNNFIIPFTMFSTLIVYSCQKEMIINVYKDLLKTESDIKYKDLLDKLSEKAVLELIQSKTPLENISILPQYSYQ